MVWKARVKMQEVFKKIIEKLEEIRSAIPDLIEYQAIYDIEDACDEIADLIKQYNNGWIPVSERFPNPEDDVLPRYRTKYLVQDKNGGMHVATFIKHNGFNIEGGAILSFRPIIAWQPLPELYQPKGDKE